MASNRRPAGQADGLDNLSATPRCTVGLLLLLLAVFPANLYAAGQQIEFAGNLPTQYNRLCKIKRLSDQCAKIFARLLPTCSRGMLRA